MKDFRGLVVTPPTSLSIAGDSILFHQTSIDPHLMRLGTLFWDQIVWPNCSIFGFGVAPEEEYLSSIGLMTRIDPPRSPNSSSNTSKIFFSDLFGVFTALDKASPGSWSFARGENSLSIVDNDEFASKEDRSLVVRLADALPIPDKDVPLEEIVRFKGQRHPELIAFRTHLEDVYQSIQDAPDKPLAERTEIARLRKAISDHTAAIGEPRWKLVKIDLTGNLNLSAAALASFAAYQAGGGALGMALSALSAATLDLSFGPGLKKRATSSPFEYITRVRKEIFQA